MVAKFDNLQDVNGKFVGTIVYYDSKPLYCKSVALAGEDKFNLNLISAGGRALESVDVEDPKLNYKEYNIGYANGGIHASWWYRRPYRQYVQGLCNNQMGCVVSTPGMFAHDKFGYSKAFIAMLENSYPSIEECKKTLMDKNIKAVAFHKDFALSYDEMHDDYVLEYHGRKIGVNLNQKLTQFRILPEARYLAEALEEACNVQR